MKQSYNKVFSYYRIYFHISTHPPTIIIACKIGCNTITYKHRKAQFKSQQMGWFTSTVSRL